MDFFDTVTLPAPAVDETWARTVVHESFGMDAVAHQLGSNQDANFLLRAPDGPAAGRAQGVRQVV